MHKRICPNCGSGIEDIMRVLEYLDFARLGDICRFLEMLSKEQIVYLLESIIYCLSNKVNMRNFIRETLTEWEQINGNV